MTVVECKIYEEGGEAEGRVVYIGRLVRQRKGVEGMGRSVCVLEDTRGLVTRPESSRAFHVEQAEALGAGSGPAGTFLPAATSQGRQGASAQSGLVGIVSAHPVTILSHHRKKSSRCLSSQSRLEVSRATCREESALLCKAF